jgi:hypothetical protein
MVPVASRPGAGELSIAGSPVTNSGFPSDGRLPLLRPAGLLRHRLRLAAFGLILLVVTLAAGLQLSGRPLFPHLFGDDLIPSYMAGTFVRQGRADLLMDYPAAVRFQAALRRSEGLDQHGRTGPWLNPPFYALPFAALSALPYRTALWTWFGFNLAMLGISVVLLYRLLPPGRRQVGDGVVIAVLVALSMPALQAMACQQNTFLSLLLLTGAVTLARAGRPAWAGLVAGLLAFKPQLAVIVWATLAATLGWRAVAGAAVTGGMLGIATLAAMPGALQDYLAKLPASLPHLRAVASYPWERQVTAQGFVRLLLQGRGGGPPRPLVALLGWLGVAVAAAGVAVVLGKAWMDRRRGSGGLSPAARDRTLAAAVTAMPLLMPYYMDYDLLLLVVPAVLLTAERCAGADLARAGATAKQGVVASATMSARGKMGGAVLAVAWVLLAAWLFVNAAVADATGVSATVLLLTLVAGGMAWRAVARPATARNAAAPPAGPERLVRSGLRVAA